MAGLTYLLVDRFDRSAALFDELIERTAALELGAEVQGARLMLPRAASVVISVAAARGTAPPAWLLSHEIDPRQPYDPAAGTQSCRIAACQRGAERRRRPAPGLRRTNLKLGWRGPANEWRSEAGLALNRLGEHERGRTLISLGAERRRRGKQASARELLRRGHELARRCHATPLSDAAAAELRAAGARPRRPVLTGPDSLTPSERRLATRIIEIRRNSVTAPEIGQLGPDTLAETVMCRDEKQDPQARLRVGGIGDRDSGALRCRRRG